MQTNESSEGSKEVKQPQKNYLLTTLLGSFWNILQFIVSLIVTTAVSILLTRHLGLESYGLFAYLTWFSSVILTVINFGIITTIQTWVPKYYFTNDLSRAAFVARKLFTIQGIIVLSSLALLIPLSFIWHKFVSFPAGSFTTLMLVNLLPMLLGILNISLSTLLVSLQRFKRAVLIYITGQVLILFAAITVVVFHFNVLGLLLLFAVAHVTMLILFVYAGRDILFQIVAEWKGKSEVKTMMTFSSWAYMSTLLSAVIWDKSEFFFLGKYGDGKSVAIYGIGYTLANMVTSILEPVISVFTTLLSELVAKKDWDRIYFIVRMCSKYFSLLLFPLVTLAYALSPYVVGFIYGKDFLLVASIFPVLLLSTILNRIFAPAWALPQYMHDLRHFVTRIAIFAPVNIALGLFLIPRYGVWGAVIANVATQASTLLYFSFFVHRYRLRLFTASYFKVVALNIIFFFAIFFTVSHASSFLHSFLISFAGVLVYALVVYKRFINAEDKQLLVNSIRVVKNRSALSG